MRSFVVTVAPADVDVVSDRLWQLGVRAVEERVALDGQIELWTAVGDDEGAIARAGIAVVPWAWHTVETTTEAADTWREFAAPMWIGERFVVVPAWLRRPATDHGVVAIEIEPGAAFGLGDHPSTALALEALMAAIECGDLTDARPSVLDVGCGTGVLAVAAAALGADHVRAIDISDAAVAATLDNARRNSVSGALHVDSTDIARVGGSFDVVVANILAPVLAMIADDLRRLTHTSGRLVISGILQDRHDHVLDALQPMVVVDSIERDGWVAVTLRHPG